MSIGVKLEGKMVLSDGTIATFEDGAITMVIQGDRTEADAALASIQDSLDHDGWYGDLCDGCGDNRIDPNEQEYCDDCEAQDEDEEEDDE